jgi:1-deoxy-D-xylulose 5-phosphate reductoisomerase
MAFLDIAELVESCLDEWADRAPSGTLQVTDVLDADAWARRRADELLHQRGMR